MSFTISSSINAAALSARHAAPGSNNVRARAFVRAQPKKSVATFSVCADDAFAARVAAAVVVAWRARRHVDDIAKLRQPRRSGRWRTRAAPRPAPVEDAAVDRQRERRYVGARNLDDRLLAAQRQQQPTTSCCRRCDVAASRWLECGGAGGSASADRRGDGGTREAEKCAAEEQGQATGCSFPV